MLPVIGIAVVSIASVALHGSVLVWLVSDPHMFGPNDLRSTLYIQHTPVDRLGAIDAKPRSLGCIGLGWNGIFDRLVLAEYESSSGPDQIQRA